MGKVPCCDKTGLKKGPWTAEEDQKLIDYIQKHGQGRWRTLPKNAGLKRCGKSCRLRWTNYLRPDIKRGRFSFEEEETIIQLHSLLGNKWSAIAARLPGRTDNEIKNYWNTHIRKRLLRMGIDPVTHTPRLDILELTSLLFSSLGNNSSQLNNCPNILGMGTTLNQNLLDLATLGLPSQKHQNPNENYLSSFGFPIRVSNINRDAHLTINNQIMQFTNHVETTPSFSSLQNSSLPRSANCIGDNNPTHYLNMSIPVTIKQTFESNNVGEVQDFGGGVGSSLSSSPMSGLMTPLKSSSTPYFNGANEDERDGYGRGDSNAVMYENDLMTKFLVSNNNLFPTLISHCCAQDELY